MKIMVISDTHGDIDKAEQAIKENDGINLVIHLGDYYRDAQKLSAIFPGIDFEYIYGNCDFMVEDVPAEKLLTCDGIRIFITHGHRYSVKWDYDRLCRKAEETNADVLLFGHTHVAEIIWKNNYFLVNPGSISEPRNSQDESYVIIDINGKGVEPRLHYV